MGDMSDQAAIDADYRQSREPDITIPARVYESVAASPDQYPVADSSSISGTEEPAMARALLADTSLSGRGNAPVRQAALLSMQRTYGNRAVQRFLQRTPVPVQRDTPAAPSTTGATGSSPAARQHPTRWFVDFNELPIHGKTERQQHRGDKGAADAAYVDLSIQPDHTDTAIALSGVNAKDTGKILLGTVQHPEEAGEVSGKVGFGNKPGLQVNLYITNPNEPDSARTKAAEKSMKTKLDEKLQDYEQSESNLDNLQNLLQQDAESILGEDEKNTYQVKVEVKSNTPSGGTAKMASVKYPKVDGPSYFNVKIRVPADRLTGTFSQTKELQEGEEHDKTKGTQTGTSTRATVSTEERTKLITGFKTASSTALKEAWQKQITAAQAARTSFRGTETTGTSKFHSGTKSVDKSGSTTTTHRPDAEVTTEQKKPQDPQQKPKGDWFDTTIDVIPWDKLGKEWGLWAQGIEIGFKLINAIRHKGDDDLEVTARVTTKVKGNATTSKTGETSGTRTEDSTRTTKGTTTEHGVETTTGATVSDLKSQEANVMTQIESFVNKEVSKALATAIETAISTINSEGQSDKNSKKTTGSTTVSTTTTQVMTGQPEMVVEKQ